jgi:aerobic-type carbon monoxide dehydrogenase small subunit (CoxS/CutS family)
MKRPIQFELNGKQVTLNTDDDRSLLWVLRTDLQLTGTKYACGEGICGACTVTVADSAVRSCRTKLRNVEGKSVVTVEGLTHEASVHPLQQAFMDHGAFQCGYCTSGMLMTAHAFLAANPTPSRSEIAAHMEHNLCRCGAHGRIIDAVESASGRADLPA